MLKIEPLSFFFLRQYIPSRFVFFFFFLKYFVLVEYNQQYKTTQSQLRISLENDDIDN